MLRAWRLFASKRSAAARLIAAAALTARHVALRRAYSTLGALNALNNGRLQTSAARGLFYTTALRRGFSRLGAWAAAACRFSRARGVFFTTALRRACAKLVVWAATMSRSSFACRLATGHYAVHSSSSAVARWRAYAMSRRRFAESSAVAWFHSTTSSTAPASTVGVTGTATDVHGVDANSVGTHGVDANSVGAHSAQPHGNSSGTRRSVEAQSAGPANTGPRRIATEDTSRVRNHDLARQLSRWARAVGSGSQTAAARRLPLFSAWRRWRRVFRERSAASARGESAAWCVQFCEARAAMRCWERWSLNRHGSTLLRATDARYAECCSLAFTRYSFTSKLYCGNLSSFYPPHTTCNAYPIAILFARPLRNIRPPTAPFF